jgi:Xaa-Pro aminopeptidase
MRTVIGDALGLVPPIKVKEAELVDPTGAVYMHMANNGLRRIDTSSKSDISYIERHEALYARDPYFLCAVKLQDSHPVAKAVKAAKSKKEKEKAKTAAARKLRAIEKAKKVLEKAGIKSE